MVYIRHNSIFFTIMMGDLMNFYFDKQYYNNSKMMFTASFKVVMFYIIDFFCLNSFIKIV